MFAKESMFANLCFQIVNSASDLLKDGTLECHVLYYVHLSTYLFLFSFIANKTGASTWEETLWILAKEQDAGCAYLQRADAHFLLHKQLRCHQCQYKACRPVRWQSRKYSLILRLPQYLVNNALSSYT